MDHKHSPGTEPSSVILSQTKPLFLPPGNIIDDVGVSQHVKLDYIIHVYINLLRNIKAKVNQQIHTIPYLKYGVGWVYVTFNIICIDFIALWVTQRNYFYPAY